MADDVIIPVRIVEEGPKPSEYFNSLGEEGQRAFLQMQRDAEKFNTSLDKVSAASRKFGESVRGVGGAAANFGSNIGRITTTAAKYFTLLTGGLAVMQKFAASQSQQTQGSKESLAAAKSDSQALTQRAQATLQNASALRELVISQSQASQDSSRGTLRAIEDVNEAFERGELTKQQQLEQTTRLEREGSKQRSRAAIDGAIAQQRLVEAQEREMQVQQQAALQRSAEEQQRIKVQEQIRRQAAAEQAYAENVKAFGSDAANGIAQFATAWDRLMDMLNQGPSLIGDALRAAAQFINQNGQEIVDTFNRIGDAFAKVISPEGTGDPATFGERIMGVFRQVAGFVENTLIPAFGKFLEFVGVIADAINGIFGTNFSATGLIVAAVILKITGAFRVLMAIVTVFKNVWLVLQAALVASGFTPVGAAIRAVIIVIGLLVVALAALNWKEIVDGAIAAWNGFVNFFQTLPGRIAQYFIDLWNRIVADVSATVQRVQQNWNDFVAWISAIPGRIAQFFVDGWESVKTAAKSAMDAIVQYALDAIPGLQRLIDLIKAGAAAWRRYSAAAAEAGANDNIEGRARGGPINGPGTSTSDSILARLSRGEYVVRAAAVAKYGRHLLDQINSMNFRGFASGGLVDAFSPSIPRFATGGATSDVANGNSKRPVIFQFPDGSEFAGEMEVNTADRLGRYANKRRTSSSGRKPTYYGGGR